ncbi:Ribonuclease H [Abeliophyllum distichum]|uniref:Ribonuclease H n=1 Tax=Abeliophyllum distichum TaxID=126358 RepID=A0ABD1NRN2_9LAMI
MRGRIPGAEGTPRPFSLVVKTEVKRMFVALPGCIYRDNASGRLLKWAVELRQFDIVYKPRAAMKGQALVNFAAEFAHTPEVEVPMALTESPMWYLFVDGCSADMGSRPRTMLRNMRPYYLASA